MSYNLVTLVQSGWCWRSLIFLCLFYQHSSLLRSVSYFSADIYPIVRRMFKCAHDKGLKFCTVMPQPIFSLTVREWSLSRTLDQSWSQGSCVVATTVTRLQFVSFLFVEFAEKSIYVDTVDTRRQLWQCVQSAANGIHNTTWLIVCFMTT